MTQNVLLRARCDKETKGVPQGLKPKFILGSFAARLKPCPFNATKNKCGSFDSAEVRFAQDDRLLRLGEIWARLASRGWALLFAWIGLCTGLSPYPSTILLSLGAWGFGRDWRRVDGGFCSLGCVCAGDESAAYRPLPFNATKSGMQVHSTPFAARRVAQGNKAILIGFVVSQVSKARPGAPCLF
jgi:hypothetical protein